jgi:integrase
MAIFKRYKGKRIKPGHKDWARARWWMEFSLRGHYVLQTIPGARTQAQAERAESAIREDIYNGRFNKSTKTGRFSEFVDKVYMPWAKANKLSWKNDESRATALKNFFGNQQVKDITPMMIRRLKNELLSEKTNRFQGETKEHTLRKGTTVNRYLQLLSKILEMAFEESLIDQNPMRRVPLETEGEGRERYLTFEEEKRLLPQLTGRLAHLYAPIVVDIDTGMRVNSELLRLQIEHCNFGVSPMFFNINGRDIEVKPNHLLVVKSKNKRPRTIPMTDRVRHELLNVIQDRTRGPVFCNARTGVSYTTLKKGFKSACLAAGIPCGQNMPGGITPHDLRHTFATRLAEKGVDESVRMALLGQSSVKMVRRYSHATPEAMTDAIERLSQKARDVLNFKRKTG